MNRLGRMNRATTARLAAALGLALAAWVGPVVAQGPAVPIIEGSPPRVEALPSPTSSLLPGAAPTALPPTAGPAVVRDLAEPATVGAPLLPPDVQVVRFHGPEGVRVDVLGPPPEPVPIGDGHGLATFGLRVGVGYRLKVTGIPGRPEAELFPVLEVVGHLHRPPGIDPAKYPIRVQLDGVDFEDVIVRGRLVTHVVYLEDPEQALPLGLPKDEIAVTSLSPVEEPIKVASALGRVMAVMHLGGRAPTGFDLSGPPLMTLLGAPCPFSGPGGEGRCPLPCGPARGTPPPAGRPWLPKDEFLCDGGDNGQPAHFGGDGGLRGIDPKDAVVRFNTETRPRILPTNTVCLYAPRFAAVRHGLGTGETQTIEGLYGAQLALRQEEQRTRLAMKKLSQNQTLRVDRARGRASSLQSRVLAGGHVEVRVFNVTDVVTTIGGGVQVQGAELSRNRKQAAAFRTKVAPLVEMTAESAVMTGIAEGTGQQVMSWKPQELAAVEVPPHKPGLAVVKQLDAAEAEPGDVVTVTIHWKNIGNVPIGSVSVVDSLLPRFEYVASSAKGPAGTVFTAGENTAGSTELRWDLPGAIPPGAEGSVSFQVKVR